jgi:Ca2+-binding RTX toxin-like protein
VTLDDTTLAAATLNTLDGNTTGTVDATTVTTLTGSAADVNTAYAAGATGTITNLGNESATLSGSASVAQLTTLDSYTSGTITAAAITDTYGNIKTLAASSPTLLQNATGTITANGTFQAETIDMSDIGALANLSINAGAGADTILGAQGDDIITGGTGADIMYGDLGSDTFVISDIETNGSDTIYAFTSSTDTAVVGAGADLIQFSSADLMAATGFVTYAGVGTSITLNDATTKVAFVTGDGAAASEAYATISYDTDTGELSFDADGTGSTASAIVVATLFSDFGDTVITDLLGVDTDLLAADLSFIA